jgi:hypothetical protein
LLLYYAFKNGKIPAKKDFEASCNSGDLDAFKIQVKSHKGLYETFEKCSILFKFKEGENFNHRNTLSILRIKI